MNIDFVAPVVDAHDADHHTTAAAGNIQIAAEAIQSLMRRLDGVTDTEKVLLRAAAGAGKSYALVRMVKEALANDNCLRVAVAAFKNKQVVPLARRLGEQLGKEQVVLFVSQKRVPELPDKVVDAVTIATKSAEIPESARVVLGVSHKFGVWGEQARLTSHLGPGANGEKPFDVLFVDEAWELPLYLFARIEALAPVAVGVGDVGQLPPIDPNENPWRGDPGYNPYRAWPTAYERAETSAVFDLPAVWRPTGEQLALWRAFYNDWDSLNCVASPGDRSMELPAMHGAAADVWAAVATGQPTMLEVAGLDEPEAPDIDRPLLAAVEELLRPLLTGGFTCTEVTYDAFGAPGASDSVSSDSPTGDPLVVLLATRNQAVDDATEMAERLTQELDLPDGVIQASTVDSWQGQTNRITVAIHPLSGASQLDDFNSAFGRLAVTCTRATHGLLMVARAGLDDLLADAAARPGTPFGEPGTRALPRQTHQRIIGSFTRGTWELSASNGQ